MPTVAAQYWDSAAARVWRLLTQELTRLGIPYSEVTVEPDPAFNAYRIRAFIVAGGITHEFSHMVAMRGDPDGDGAAFQHAVEATVRQIRTVVAERMAQVGAWESPTYSSRYSPGATRVLGSPGQGTWESLEAAQRGGRGDWDAQRGGRGDWDQQSVVLGSSQAPRAPQAPQALEKPRNPNLLWELLGVGV